MSVLLRKRSNKDGTTSLYLDIYHHGKRKYEFLQELKLNKPSNPFDRERNKTNMDLAKHIAAKRAIEIESSDHGITAKHKSKVDVLEYMANYIARYTKKDIRNMEGAFNRFKKFLKEEKIKNLTMNELDEGIVRRFADDLQATCDGEGAASYFARFKKVLKQAVRDKVLPSNPSADITIKRVESLTKDILSIEEIQKMASTEVSNQEVKKAFLFCCFTGLRWVDVVALKWKHIDLKKKMLIKLQAKTDLQVSVNLHTTALGLLPQKGGKDDLVFQLPTHTGALKTLRTWTALAEIDKHITWHCARHSFATNLIFYANDVTIVSKLLGHSSLKYTQRYTHIANDMKEKAVNTLPEIKF